MSAALQVVVADDERDTREFLEELLLRHGHRVALAEDGKQLLEQCHRVHPDLVIADIKMPFLDGIQAALELNRERPIPVILISAHHEPELLERAGAEPIVGYLVKPVKPADVETAIPLALKRFEQTQSARKEAAHLRQMLEERKLVERAKGIVMRRLSIGEEEAFRRLRKVASDQNRKVTDVSTQVLEAEVVFRELDRVGEGTRPR